MHSTIRHTQLHMAATSCAVSSKRSSHTLAVQLGVNIYPGGKRRRKGFQFKRESGEGHHLKYSNIDYPEPHQPQQTAHMLLPQITAYTTIPQAQPAAQSHPLPERSQPALALLPKRARRSLAWPTSGQVWPFQQCLRATVRQHAGR